MSTKIYLTTGSSWTVPDDWNSSDNTIECIGGGATGTVGSGTSYNGGGGGAYAKVSNLSITGSITYQVGGVAGDTWFNGASLAASSVGAKGASGKTGGQAGSCVGDTKYSGGDGGTNNANGYSGAGGGAAGLNGAGNNGASSSGNPTTGGSGDAGFGGAGGIGSGDVTRDGGDGTEWDSTHGSGGGGNGVGYSVRSGNGGLYGAGGGGSYDNSAGVGAQGLIVITYTPTFSNSGNVYSSNNTYATLPATSGDLLIALSKNGGSTYTSPLTKTFTSTEEYLTYGTGSTELWGTTWTGDDVDNTSFRLKIYQGTCIQIYKDFTLTMNALRTIVGIEVLVEAKYISGDSKIYIDHIKVKVYSGSINTSITAGSQAFASNGRKNGEGAGVGTGVQVFYDGNHWIACDTGQTVAA